MILCRLIGENQAAVFYFLKRSFLLDANEYQRLAARTINPELDYIGNITNAALGMSGEAGEIADHIKKYLYHGHEFDIAHLSKELGDVLWYVCQMATANDLELSDIMAANIDKLRRRYPGGFNYADSINRVE